MKRLAVGILFLAAVVCAAQSDAGKSQKPPSSRDDISGMYSFLQEGEFVQINLEEDRVTGFVSRYSDSEKAIFLDHFFSKAALHDHDLSFTTKVVHGVWFEFQGKVERGEAKTRSQEGYYLLNGTLTQYTSDATKKVSARSRQVSFKSFPEEAEEEGPKK